MSMQVALPVLGGRAESFPAHGLPHFQLYVDLWRFQRLHGRTDQRGVGADLLRHRHLEA